MSILEPYRENMDKLKYIFDNAKVGIAICNAEDNTLEMVNPAFAHIHGYTPYELIGASPGEVFAPECMLRLEAHENAPSCAIDDVSFETTHIKKDGSSVAVAVHITVIKDEKGIVKQRIANIQDISERKKQEMMVQSKEQKFRSLSENLPGFAYTYRLLPDGREEFLYVSGGIVDTYGVEPEIALCNIAAVREVIYPDDIAGFRAAIAESARTLNPFHAEFRVMHPVKGKLWLEARATPEEVHSDGSIIWHGITLDITERKTQEELFCKKEQEFRTLAENSPDVIVRYDRDLKRLYANPAWEKVNGIPVSDVIGKTPTEKSAVIAPIAESYEANLKKVIETGENAEIELTWQDDHGKTVWFNQCAVAEFDQDGTITGILTIARDVTPHKELQKLLAAREQEFRAVVENSPDTISRYDLECRRIYVNPKFEELLGLPAEALLGKTPSELSPIPENFGFEDKLRDVARSGREIVAETLFFTPSGEIGWGHLRIVPEFGENGDVVTLLAIGRDITERKKQELQLHSQEQEFRSLAENARDPIYRYDRSCRRIYVNPAVERLSGKPSSTLLGKTPLEAAFVPSEEVMKVMQSLEQVIETGKSDEIEVKFVSPEGREYCFQHSHVPEFGADGAVESVLAIGRDVTAQKQLQKDLNAREEMFRTLAENSPNIIMRYDQECRRIYANPAYSAQTGIPAVAAQNGKPDTQWGTYLNMLTMSAQEYQERLKNVIQSGKNDSFTVEWYRLNDGVHVIHDLHVVAERGENGEVIGALTIGHDITERKSVEKKIEHMAHHDALTGLPNRILAKDRTEQAIAYAKRNHSKTALLFIDLDGFKSINDTLGHSVGDAVLKAVTSRLKESVRESDTISRQGGDEFLLILPDVNTLDDILIIADKLIQGFEETFHIGDHPLSLSASIGIALYPDHGDTFESLLKNADTAMYKAKESGKNGYCLYTEQMNHNLIGQFKIQSDLKTALQNNEFILHYQPQIDLACNRILGAEALIRWRHPQLGLIPPMSFIPIAESSGLMVQIGQWVIEEACAQAALWHERGMEITVAVNISAVQFKRGNLEAVVKHALASSGLNPKFLELELTESIMMHNIESTLQTVQNFKALGIQLSIDDFGTGYSSLAYLKRFAVDKLKIDQSFVRDIQTDQEDAVIVQTIIQMAKSLNLKSIAEGVENKEVLAIINGYGCDEVQGYHFAKPLEAADFEHYHATFSTHINL